MLTMFEDSINNRKEKMTNTKELLKTNGAGAIVAPCGSLSRHLNDAKRARIQMNSCCPAS